MIEAVEIPTEEVDDAGLRALLSHWDRVRAGRALAARRAIRPEDMPYVLGRVNLIDVVDPDSPRFRIRLMGTKIAENLGHDWSGLDVTEVRPLDYRDMIVRHFAAALRRRQAMAHIIRLRSEDKVSQYLRVLLPLSEDGEHVTTLLSAATVNRDIQQAWERRRLRGEG